MIARLYKYWRVGARASAIARHSLTGLRSIIRKSRKTFLASTFLFIKDPGDKLGYL